MTAHTEKTVFIYADFQRNLLERQVQLDSVEVNTLN
jgi:hypothetical protein